VHFLADAKYKGTVGRGNTVIGNADIYESEAFLIAAGTDRLALLHPKVAEPADEPLEVGTCERFSRVDVGEHVILGIEVEARAIGAPGGYARFSENLANGLRDILEAETATLAMG